MNSGEMNVPYIQESSKERQLRSAQQISKLKRDLTMLVRENGIGDMLETKDRVVAEYLLRSLLSLFKTVDDINDWKS